MSKFLNNFSGAEHFTKKVGAAHVTEEFETNDPLTDDEVVVADYTYQEYEGSAFVLFVRNGVAYEVNGSHCSCYGLEGQWTPEETDSKALLMRTPDAFPSNECYEIVQAWAKGAK